ncbi:GAF domain-containing protein [Actinoplanes sp. DH11]|uniref:GAF domain-containing protein n=1 Tax=Actinoplanes sp. DH11 TaxID=2857011 RepID=UPI001E376C64|nr:GAF domain-containing protein [Actinoplanes sp. DH11]
MILTRYPELRDPARLREVARLGVDREAPRDYLAELVEQVAVRIGTPFAVVTVLLSDAQVFLAGYGPMPEWLGEAGGTPIEWAFCRPLLRQRGPHYVNDFTTDPEYRHNPLVTVEGVRSYIGAPVVSARGQILGSICGLDLCPRDFDAGQLRDIQNLAGEAARRMEAHADHPATE